MKVITTVLASVVLVGGLGASAYAMTDQSKSNDKTQTTIEEAKAKDIALQKTDGGDITHIQLAVDDGVKQYEIEITKGNKEYDVDIDSSSGKIIEFDEEQKDDDDDEKEEKLQNASPAIPLDQAIKTALKSAKGTVDETDLYQENNRLVYEIEIDTVDKREATVSVDAQNGNVISVEIDD